jgi:hypothetical protein
VSATGWAVPMGEMDLKTRPVVTSSKRAWERENVSGNEKHLTKKVFFCRIVLAIIQKLFTAMTQNSSSFGSLVKIYKLDSIYKYNILS